MRTICPSSRCTGCSACANACPKMCISIVEDCIFGHYKPKINPVLCINCGRCQKVCPQNITNTFSSPFTAFAAWSKDLEDYRSSTSGGVSSVIAAHAIRNGGVVYGCVISETLQPKHVRIDKYEDLNLIKGSKYVQSKIDENLFKLVLSDLNSGKNVVFLGTPCQNAGLKSFLKNSFNNLLQVDIICHGVPSWKMLRDHISSIVVIDKVKKYGFRSSKGYVLYLLDSNNIEIYHKRIQDDGYCLGFIKGLFSNESCYTCQYSNIKRCTDITIGDFWGIGKLSLSKQPTDGISLILPNSPKGLDFIAKIKENLYIEERTVEEAERGNKQLRRPCSIAIGHNIMTLLYPKIGFNNAYKISFGIQSVFYKLVYWLLSLK